MPNKDKCPHQSCTYTPAVCGFQASHWNQSGLSPDLALAEFVKDVATESKWCRENIPTTLDIRYGRSDNSNCGSTVGNKDDSPSSGNQYIDLYGDEALPDSAPIFVFVHGGLWTAGSREISACMARTFTEKGIVTAVVGYDLAPAITLTAMIDQITGAFGRLCDVARSRGSDGIFICGYSAGAQLALMGLVRLSFLRPDVLNSVRRIFLLSGVYDLQPLLGSCVAADLGINEANYEQCNPVSNIDDIVGRVVSSNKLYFVYGEFESQTYQEQSKNMYGLLSENENACLMMIESVDHFSLVSKFKDKDYKLTKFIIDAIKQ